MKHAFIAIALLSVTPADAAFLSSAVNGAGAVVVDNPQYPSLLSSYTYRPAWSVAGVDYYVGLPSSIILKDPATMSIPGTSVDLGNHRIIVDNTATNVVIDGYDFSLNGGWYVLNYTNVGTLTIKNSKFVVGSNHQTPINALSGTANVTILNNTFDGNFDLSTTLSTFVSFSGTGTFTAQYNWFKRAVSDVIDVNNVPANIVLQYNLFDDTGAPGVHGDILQILGTGPYYATVQYNTVRQSAGLSAQGFMLEPDNGAVTGVVSGGTVAYNTFTGAISYFTAVTIADLTGTYTAHDNYFELADGAFGFAPGGSRGGYNDGQPLSVYTNNINMVSGALYQDTPPGTP